MYIYKAMRHHAPVEDEFATLEEAIARARCDYETDQAYPIQITHSIGETVIDHVAMCNLLAGHAVSIGMTENGEQFQVS